MDAVTTSFQCWELAAGVGDDLDRIYENLTDHGAENIEPRIRPIIQAIAVLEQNPLMANARRATSVEIQFLVRNSVHRERQNRSIVNGGIGAS